MQKIGRLSRRGGRRSAAYRKVAALVAVASVGLGGALTLGVAPSSAAPPPYDNPNFNPETGVGANTYTAEEAFNAACPQSIAETPGSEPAAKALNNALNDADSFTPGGTIHYVFYDNPNFASQNFTLQDCIAAYPADEFDASDFDEFGVLRNASKTDLTSNATALDQVGLNGIVQSDGIIYYSWTAPGTLTPGSWICNFARDVATGHGGEGNRKSMAVCYQVTKSVTPAEPEHDETTDCDVMDSYTIPSTVGVSYLVGETLTGPGTYDLPAGTTVEITAVADDYYFFPEGATTSWSFTGSAVEECEGPGDPADPTHTVNTACGVEDTYTIPSSPGFVYLVDGVETAAGTYDLPAGVTVIITAIADDNEVLEVDVQAPTWEFTGSEVPTCPRSVTPAVPTHTESSACGVQDTFTIPTTAGVIYKVGDVVTAAGTYDLGAGSTVVITAVPEQGVSFAEGAVTSWSFTGSPVQACSTTTGGGDPTPTTTTTVAPTTTTTEAPATTTTTQPELAFTGAPEAVVAEVPAPTTTVPAAPELPFTGSNTVPMAIAAMGMLGVGVLCVAASRRKQRA